MAADLSAKTIEETRRILLQLMPTRTHDERQLARPTFALIHELARSLTLEHRLLRATFTRADLEPRRGWDRRSRESLVQRLIDFAAANGEPARGCVAGRLAAGLDAPKAHELLQALGRLALAKPVRPRTVTRQARQSLGAPAAAASLAPERRPSASSTRPNSGAASPHAATTLAHAEARAPAHSTPPSLSPASPELESSPLVAVRPRLRALKVALAALAQEEDLLRARLAA